MLEANKQVVLRWFNEVWNQRRETTIDELLHADAKIHGLSDDDPVLNGPSGFRVFYRAFKGALPDIHVTVDDILAEGDRVVAICTARGTHSGVGLGFAPTNKPAVIRGVAIAKVANGQIVEGWNFFDFLKFYQGLGASTPKLPK